LGFLDCGEHTPNHLRASRFQARSLWFIYSIFIEITAAPDLLFFTITSLHEGKDANNSAGQRVGFDLC
jgi:uncharacterized protein (DUF1810 family)